MAEIATTFTTVSAAPVFSLCATTSDKVKDLAIKNGQLIFIHNVGRIAFDFNGKRTFYNQVIELETDVERVNLTEPENGKYYFIIDTAVFWRYFDGWIQLTKEPEEILFINTEFPKLGQANKLYINSTEGNESISIFDEETNTYKVVADKTQTVSVDDVRALFN